MGRDNADTILFLVLGSRRSNLHLQHFPVVDFHRTGFPKGVSSKAAPMPKFRGGHQSALHWIAVHIAQFFDAFSFRPHVEVVEALLPDVLWSVLKQSVLRGVALPFRLFQNSPRKTEFERLHHRRWVLFLRFADEKMNVFGHDHVSDDDKLIATAHLLEHGQKQAPTLRSSEPGLAAIATAGNEM